MTEKKTKSRTEILGEKELLPNSLVGSFFHGDDEHQYQGVIVAEPVPGIYLAELFDWFTGMDSTEQQLFRIEDMLKWHFYDDASWMNNRYHNYLQGYWASLPDSSKDV